MNLRQVRALLVHEPTSYLTNPSDHPDRATWDAVGRRYQEHFLGDGPGDWRHPWDVAARKGKSQHHAPEEPIPRQPSPIKATASCKVQVVRSVCDWSHGTLTEHSIQNACKEIPQREFTRAQCMVVFRSPNDHGSRAFHLYWCVTTTHVLSRPADKTHRESVLVCLMTSGRLDA